MHGNLKRVGETELKIEIFATDGKELSVNVNLPKDMNNKVRLFKRFTIFSQKAHTIYGWDEWRQA